MSNYTTDNIEEYRRLQLIAQTQPIYGAVQGRGGGDDAGLWMRGPSQGGGQKEGGEGVRVVSCEIVAREPALS